VSATLQAIQEDRCQSFHVAPQIKVLNTACAPALANSFTQFWLVGQAGATRIGPMCFELGNASHRAGCGKGHRAFTITVSGGFILFSDLHLAVAAVEPFRCVGSMC
jgi:hypothetical protein